MDDDATINASDERAEDWLAEHAAADLVIARQPNLFLHRLSATQYFDWGVWLAQNTPWARGVLHELLHAERCSDLHVADRVGNPEQDCFARLTYDMAAAPRRARASTRYWRVAGSFTTCPARRWTAYLSTS